MSGLAWQERWRALDARIGALVEVGTFLLRTGAVVGSDYAGVINHYVIPGAREVFSELEALRSAHGSVLPPLAAKSLEGFTRDQAGIFRLNSQASGWPGLQMMVGALASFSAEFRYHVVDAEAASQALTLRALIHLQRSIVADPDCRERWRRAFDDGETACEKLGAVHLLGHGIWAFKANAAGERTDLVLGEPLQTGEAESAAQALVLTEWKVVRTTAELGQKADQALTQAKRYAAGILWGFELATIRFLILVSEGHIPPPETKTIGEVSYRYFNIAVNPESPSRGRD